MFLFVFLYDFKTYLFIKRSYSVNNPKISYSTNNNKKVCGNDEKFKYYLSWAFPVKRY